MRTFLIILVAIIILGGGWYWYSQQNMVPATTTMQDTSMQDTSMQDTGTRMEDGTVPENTNSGTNVDVGGSAAVSTGAIKVFTVTGANFKFAPSTLSVKKGDTVKITFVNSSGTHDWNLDEFNAHSGIIQSGASRTVTFVADKIGSFEYYCAVGNHRAMGMKGTLTVTN